ncbi:MAG: hypothetical protein E7291_10100 [Lachnospiraceae bacterium]|nr:hypothetical protein [Lachnospiraceae bacterium]
MDKYEYKIRASEIKELIEQQEYAQAAEIADTIDWRRVKSVMMLCMISDLYKINRRYEDARDMLLLAYERRPGGRTICYSLCELSIKMEEYVQAIEYYKEYVQATSSPLDTGRYILQYKLYEAQDVSLEERIAVLEKLKQCDYLPKWGYELAYLYHRVGLASRCVEECDELIVWFGDGKYVIKAMELKMLHQPLTAEQQAKYDHRFDELELSPQEPVEEVVPEQSVVTGDTQIYRGLQNEEAVAQQPEEMDIHVKTMDVGQYNTINLQAELAAGLQEVLSREPSGVDIENPVTRSIVAPMLESDTESLDYPEIDEVSEDDLESAVEEIEGSEVFFGETEEISSLQVEEALVVEEEPEEILADEDEQVEEVADETVPEAVTVPDVTGEIVMEQLRQESIPGLVIPEFAKAMNVEPPKSIAHVLSQESDGQLSLVMPEKETIEKQITGQISLTDILAEWERVKKENQEKREEEVRQHVLQQTGTMFTEFEASVRDGLLEQLERGKDITGEQEEITEEMPEEFLEEPTEEISEEIMEESSEEIYEETPEEIIEGEGLDEDALAEIEEFDEVEELEEILEETEEAVEEESCEEFEAGEMKESADEIDESAEGIEEFTEEIEEFAAEEAEESAAEETAPVEREKAKIRSLTREEKELYAPFIQSRAAKEQLVKAIDSVSLAAYTGNIIITGEEGMDTLSLAKNMIREIQVTDSNFSGKVAKISGQALNGKDVEATLEQLKNGALIISKASGMNDDTADALYKSLQQERMGIVIVLEDTKKAIDKFLTANEQMKASFTARVDVEALSNDMLVSFARQYAREKEYAIDDFGVLALHTRIEDMQTIDHAVTVLEVKEIVDEAIAHANRKTLGHFFDILLAKRYDEEDMIILGEKDFT